MDWIQRLLKQILAFALALVLMLAVAPESASAQSGNPATNFLGDVINRVRSVFVPPRSLGTPTGRPYGGTGRGKQCPSVEQSLVALVPSLPMETEASELSGGRAIAPTSVWGKTVEPNPTLWFYVPYSDSDGFKSAKFMLLDTDKHPVLSQPVSVTFSGTPGIIGFRIPYTLEVNQLYNWYFSIVCDASRPSRNPGVRGWIQRVEPGAELVTAVEQVAPSRKYLIYAENGIWYDTVTELTKNRQRNPKDEAVQRDWVSLLGFLDLSELEQATISDCCVSRTEAE
jgi:Domain of Unknown Function (DUF928)